MSGVGLDVQRLERQLHVHIGEGDVGHTVGVLVRRNAANRQSNAVLDAAVAHQHVARTLAQLTLTIVRLEGRGMKGSAVPTWLIREEASRNGKRARYR